MHDRSGNIALLVPGVALLALAFVLPILQMLALSVTGEGAVDRFDKALTDPFYLGVLWRTVRLSLVITTLCALVGFPLAYLIARAGPRLRIVLLIIVVLPLMTSVVVRTFGWMVLLSRGGLVAQVARELGLANRSFSLMHSETAIVLGLSQVLLPFMVLSILGVLTRIDTRLEEAARTMGASFGATLRSVVLPLALPGLVAGSLLCFALSASSFVTPSLLGGSRIQVLAASIYTAVTQTLDWPFAATLAVVLFAGVTLVLAPYMRIAGPRHG